MDVMQRPRAQRERDGVSEASITTLSDNGDGLFRFVRGLQERESHDERLNQFLLPHLKLLYATEYGVNDFCNGLETVHDAKKLSCDMRCHRLPSNSVPW